MNKQNELQPYYRALKILILICGSFILCWKIGTGYASWLESSKTFNVEKIIVQGFEIFEEADILRMGGVNKNQSIWEMNLKVCEERISGNPFIENVRLRRQFPDRLIIDIEEKQPVALVNNKGRLYCIDQEGLILPSKSGKLYALPLISGYFQGKIETGKFGGGYPLQQGLHLVQLIRNGYPVLYNEISEIKMDRNGYRLYTKTGGVPVYLGEKELLKKLKYLEAIIDHLSGQKKLRKSRYIDLRFRNQVIVG